MNGFKLISPGSVTSLVLCAFFAAACLGPGCKGGGGAMDMGTMMNAGLVAGSAMTMGEEQEDELGRSVAIAATNQWRLYDRPQLNRYVTLVGLTVASASQRKPDANWVFGVLDTPEMGAYSGPGGYVMITRGALAAMEDESELAGVLAHEIAHVLNQDGLKAVKNARMTQAGMMAASAADRRLAEFNQMSGHLVETVLKSGWSQDQETRADKDGVNLLIAAGYDPRGLPRFLTRMQKRYGGSGRAFSTHPGTADRIARISSQIGDAKAGATNRERFAKSAAEAKL